MVRKQAEVAQTLVVSRLIGNTGTEFANRHLAECQIVRPPDVAWVQPKCGHEDERLHDAGAEVPACGRRRRCSHEDCGHLPEEGPNQGRC